jgi:hypothetical protein
VCGLSSPSSPGQSHGAVTVTGGDSSLLV